MPLFRRSDNGRHPLKIVVTVKQVPDPNSNLTLEADNSISREKEVVLDPGDECGVEEALQLREAHGGEVVLVSMGPERAKDAIRKGLSMGADRGVLITDPELAGADALQTARVLAAAIKPASRPASGPASRFRSKTTRYGTSCSICSGSPKETTTSENAGASRSTT